MKEDIIIYLLLPPFLFIITTMITAILPLLKLIDISAELINTEKGLPSVELFLILLILYYGVVAFIASDSAHISQGKSQHLRNCQTSLPYGAETKIKLQQLRQTESYKRWKKRKQSEEANQTDEKLQQKGRRQFPKSKGRPVEMLQENSEDDDSCHEAEINCHQVATSKKMF